MPVDSGEQNFSDLRQGEHFCFRVEWGGRKNVRFSTENWPYLRNGEKRGQCYY